MKCESIGRPYGLPSPTVVAIINRLGISMKRGKNGTNFSGEELLRIQEEIERIMELRKRGIKVSRNGSIIEGDIQEIIKVHEEKPVREPPKKEEPVILPVIKEIHIIKDMVTGKEEVVEEKIIDPQKVEEPKVEVKPKKPRKPRRKPMSKEEKEFAMADETLDEVLEEVEADDMEDEYDFDDDDLDDEDWEDDDEDNDEDEDE